MINLHKQFVEADLGKHVSKVPKFSTVDKSKIEILQQWDADGDFVRLRAKDAFIILRITFQVPLGLVDEPPCDIESIIDYLGINGGATFYSKDTWNTYKIFEWMVKRKANWSSLTKAKDLMCAWKDPLDILEKLNEST